MEIDVVMEADLMDEDHGFTTGPTTLFDLYYFRCPQVLLEVPRLDLSGYP